MNVSVPEAEEIRDALWYHTERHCIRVPKCINYISFSKILFRRHHLLPFLLCITRCSRRQPLFHISPMHAPLRRELLPYTAATLSSMHTRNFHSLAIKKNPQTPKSVGIPSHPFLPCFFLSFLPLFPPRLFSSRPSGPHHPPISAQRGTCPLPCSRPCDGHAKESRLPGHVSAASGGSCEYPHSHRSLLSAVLFSPSALLAARTTEPCPAAGRKCRRPPTGRPSPRSLLCRWASGAASDGWMTMLGPCPYQNRLVLPRKTHSKSCEKEKQTRKAMQLQPLYLSA